MTDGSTIYEALSSIRFNGYAETVSSLLSAFGVADITIRKITEKIETGDLGPFYIYRRALLLCSAETQSSDTLASYSEAFPLVIVIQPEGIVIKTQEDIQICEYEHLAESAQLLSGLSCGKASGKDHYKTLELDQLVESLYRSLILDNNDKESSRRFIFSLLYISHFSHFVPELSIDTFLSSSSLCEEDKLANIFKLFSKVSQLYVEAPTGSLNLSKESNKYVFGILRFDIASVDIEVLTSLIYRVIDVDEAGLFGHQTSFVNVKKVLKPLIFEDIDIAIANATEESVNGIVERIKGITVLDPTNGPGCYLASSYSGLAERLDLIREKFPTIKIPVLSLGNFVGLVTQQLTKDLTILALTIVHTQVISRTSVISVEFINSIADSLQVYICNELTSDWGTYVPKNALLRIVGSPEYKGSNRMLQSQKEEMMSVFASNNLHTADYCSSWLVKAAHFIGDSKGRAAFVLTNSVSQGAQASYILDKVNEAGCEYIFCHRSFKWKTSSSDNVGVTVVIIGLSSKDSGFSKRVHDGNTVINCSEIGPSLLPDIDIRIKNRTHPLSTDLPEMKKGNMSYCADALIFSADELDTFLSENPEAKEFVRPLYGSEEFVDSKPRYCLWITDNNLDRAREIRGIAARIEQVRLQRQDSTASKKCKENPHKFRDTNTTSKGRVSLIVPCVTSEKRFYFQMGIVDDKTIVNNLACVIYDCDLWLLALLESRMHTIWAKNAAGGHETRPRYSCNLCYNTFPMPNINSRQKDTLRVLSRTLLEVREKYCDKPLSELYTNLPPELQRVHHLIDATVDSYYRSQPFGTDAERLIWLKCLYNQLIENE